jgi:hypothetical protein
MKGSFLNIEYRVSFFDMNHGIALAARTRSGRSFALRSPLWAGPYVKRLHTWLYGHAEPTPRTPQYYAKYKAMQSEQYPKK